MAYQEALVYTQSEDGLLLTGIHIVPAQHIPPVTGIVWIHGNTGTFYDWPYVAIGRALAEHGYRFLSGNTRGHDIATTLYRLPQDIPVAGGSAWECLEDAPADVSAWVEVAMRSGVERVVLIGHSQGATKVVTYQGQRADQRIAGVILVSPEQYGHWAAVLDVAQQHVMADHPVALLTVFPEEPWYQLSAQNIVSREKMLARAYTAAKDAPYLATIACPILAVYGTAGDVGGSAELEVLRHTIQQSQRMDTHLIEGADHVYTGYEEALARVIADWIARAS